ncbi:FAD synthase-like [Cydia splendana]|uniref:FAD synthase-like n=1 Tax=Cydia splendana TaxID=1100963 RepID=UPI002137AFBB
MPQKGEAVCVVLPDFTDVLEECEQVLRKCFKKYKIDEVFLSFNGGKDCTVLLDIAINVLTDIYKDKSVIKNLKVLYIRTKSPFKELEEFVKQVELHYGITLEVTEGELKSTLQRIMDRDNRLKACLMGTRRTDPYSHDLQFMQKTDADWPQIMRVSPLLNWSYHQIWSYILARQVPYCSLYDQGYTSIGSTLNTWPNPALAVDSGYRPAWQLVDGTRERAGRVPPDAQNGVNGKCEKL